MREERRGERKVRFCLKYNVKVMVALFLPSNFSSGSWQWRAICSWFPLWELWVLHFQFLFPFDVCKCTVCVFASLRGFLRAAKIRFSECTLHRSDLFFFYYCFFNRVFIHATYRAVHGQSHPSFRFGRFACSCNSSKSMHVMRKWGRKQRSNLGCETARGLGGDTVTRWCYSNLFGRQSYAETEGLMSQSSWSEFGCRHYVLPSTICMPLKSWMGTTQETSKKWSGPRYKDGPLCTSEGVKWKSKFFGCTTERLFEWVSLSCCVS